MVGRKQSHRHVPRRVPWAIAVPGVGFLVIFHFMAPLSAIWYAFTDWNGLSDPHWVGLDNFRLIFTTAETRSALFHTLILAIGFVIAVNIIGCALALALNRTLKSRNVIRAVIFLPVVLTPLATSYVWSYIFTYDGALNRFLTAVSLDSWVRPWIGDPEWALWTILVVMIWQYCGLAMIIYLAGLQGIPPELDEAAAVDGASAWFRFTRITLQLLAPAITVTATLTLIIGLRAFDQIIALTGGGPIGATETLATQVWAQTFQFGRFGYGAALSLVLAIVIATLTLGQLMILRGRETRL